MILYNLIFNVVNYFYKGIMPGEKGLDFSVDCNILIDSVIL